MVNPTTSGHLAFPTADAEANKWSTQPLQATFQNKSQPFPNSKSSPIAKIPLLPSPTRIMPLPSPCTVSSPTTTASHLPKLDVTSLTMEAPFFSHRSVDTHDNEVETCKVYNKSTYLAPVYPLLTMLQSLQQEHLPGPSLPSPHHASGDNKQSCQLNCCDSHGM